MTKARSNRTNNAEIERLRMRLAEAEETLHAIRAGEVDAIAVDGPHGRQLFTLQSADQPYRVLAERMSEGAASMTADGTILFCNQRLSQMVDRNPAAMVGLSAIMLVPPGSKKEFQEFLARGLKGEARRELQFQRSDGSVIPVLASLTAIPGEQGPGLCLVAMDFSEHRRAERAIQAERRRFEAVLDSLPVMVCLLAPDYKVAFANQAFRKQFGESNGRKCYEYCFDKTSPCDFCESFRVLETKAPHDWEVATPDGHLIHAFDFPFTDADGSQLILEMDVDITEQRQAEKKLREQAALLDLAHDAILVRSLDSQILFWSRGATDTYGFSVEEALGRIGHELLQTGFPASLEAITRSIQQNREWEGELRHTRKDGRAIVVSSRWSLLRDEHGEPTKILEINRDITERKQAEEARQKASHYARSLIEASLDPLVTISRAGKITDVNEATEKVTGISGKRLIGTDFCDYFTEPEKAREGYEKAFAEGAVHDYPLAIRSASGVVTDVLYNASVFRNETGEVEGVFAAARDVTERKRAELALKKASLYTRSLIEASQDPLVTISREGKITDVNEATEKVTGVDRERLIGTDFSDYFVEPDEARRGYQAVFAQGSVLDYPLAIRHTSGQIIDVLYNANVFRNEAGEVEGVFAAARDITRRKASEARVAAERQKFNLILDVLTPYVVLLTPDYHVAFANREFERRFGKSQGRRCFEFLFERNEPCEICETYKVLKTGTAQDWNWTGPDGRAYEIHDFPFTDTDGSKLILEMGIDVTERKQAEAEVRKLNQELEQRVAARTEELRGLNKELEAFNYAVAHDLRAPLRHIHGFAEMLADEAKPVLTDSCKHQLDTILDSVQHMSELLEDLLKLSRLGRQELCKQVCSANKLIEEAIRVLEPESKGREVEWRITDLAPVECDPPLFKQVLVNLLSNALKFTRTRHPAIIEIGQETIDGEAVIFVRDNGVGFSMEYADKLFGLFQRLHRQQDFEGTGVGLAIVQRIMHRHGGRVWAEAEPDKGATFYLSLHRGEAGKKELAAAHAAI